MFAFLVLAQKLLNPSCKTGKARTHLDDRAKKRGIAKIFLEHELVFALSSQEKKQTAVGTMGDAHPKIQKKKQKTLPNHSK